MSVNIKGLKKYHRSDKPEKKSLKCKIGIDESLFSLGVNGGKKIGGGGLSNTSKKRSETTLNKYCLEERVCGIKLYF